MKAGKPDQTDTDNLGLFWLLAFVIACLFFAFFAMKHSYNLFGDAVFEMGDFAVNALQINRAAECGEIHGNYSRWRFNHPGPAFFYIYAWGEKMFHHWIPLTKSPHQSHALAAIILQSIFFGLGVASLSKLSGLRLPLFFSSIVLVHLSLADRSAACIWAPSWLLGPTFALYPVAALVSLGNVSFLPVLVLTGGFLLHAHVAQPLFVGPIVLFAICGLILNLKRQGFRAGIFWPALWTTLAASLIALPLLLDALQLEDSNLTKIIAHLARSSEDGKSFIQSLVYLGSFFVYNPTPEQIVSALTWDDFLLLCRQASLVACLVGIFFAGSFFFAARRWAGVKRLIFLSIGGVVLSVQWGMMQSGEMYAFNSYFFYSLILLLLAPACLFVDAGLSFFAAPVRYAMPLSLSLVALAVPVQVPAFIQSSEKAPVVVQNALSAVHDRESVKLQFKPEDWPMAAAVALQLDRAKVSFLVDEEWGFMFGKEHVASTAHSDVHQIWHVESATAAEGRIHPMLVLQDVPMIEVSFSFDSPQLSFENWSHVEPSHRWSLGTLSSVSFSIDAGNQSARRLLVKGWSLGVQRMGISLNGRKIHDATLTGAPQLLVIDLPSGLLGIGDNTLKFDLPDARVPGTGDPRTLGFALESIVLE
jgi:hypothetical protein